MERIAAPVGDAGVEWTLLRRKPREARIVSWHKSILSSDLSLSAFSLFSLGEYGENFDVLITAKKACL